MASSEITLYGIKNCDTVRKARKWLEANGVAYTFHDFKTDSLSQAQFDKWLTKSDLFTVINKRSTTWKQLSDEQKTALTENKNFDVVQNNLSLIKRPVIEKNHSQIFGFNEDQYKAFI